MKHLGDYATSTIVYGKFTTYRPSTGAPFTLAGTPALSVYKDNSVTQSTTGVTLTADFDSVTGLNHFAIDTSADGAFYAAGSFFDIVITTGTVDSVSAVGTVVAGFTLLKDSSLKPTTAGRTLDVTAAGEAGLDWANIGSPTSAQTLSGTTVGTATALGAGAVSAAAIATGAIDADALAADAVAEIADGVWDEDIVAAHGTADTAGRAIRTLDTISDRTNNSNLNSLLGVADVASADVASQVTDEVWDELQSGHTTASTFGKFLDVEVSSRNATTPPTAGAVADAVWDEARADHTTAGSFGQGAASVQGNITGSVASVTAGVTVASGGIGSGAHTAAELNAIADANLDRNMATGTDSGAPTVRTVRQALRGGRNKTAIVAGTLTVYKEDDTTASWTGTVTTAAGNPIDSIDPASV